MLWLYISVLEENGDRSCLIMLIHFPKFVMHRSYLNILFYRIILFDSIPGSSESTVTRRACLPARRVIRMHKCGDGGGPNGQMWAGHPNIWLVLVTRSSVSHTNLRKTYLRCTLPFNFLNSHWKTLFSICEQGQVLKPVSKITQFSFCPPL